MEHTRVQQAGALPVLPVAEGRGVFVPAPRGWTWLAPAISLFAACAGSASERAALSVIDDATRVVHLDSPATRIVSTLPAVTDLILALGEADRLVARTAYDTDTRIAHLPSFGPSLTPSPEALVYHAPDLVIQGADGMSGPAPLATLGVPGYIADVRTIADIDATVRKLGVLLGVPDRADSLAHAIATGLADVRRSVSGSPRPTVLYLLWPDPPQTTGSGTFVDEVIAVAGGRNAFGDVDIPWPQVSLEEIVRRDPDVLVLSHAGARAIESNRRAPGWRDLTALRTGRVILVDADLFDRPGPRVVEAARTLARALHADTILP